MRIVGVIGLVLALLCSAASEVAGSTQTEDVARTPVCASCGERIIGEYATALGKSWHPEHFVCTHCSRPFARNTFYEKSGLPYCESCYAELFCPRCSVCGLPIRSTYVENIWGDVYCASHEDDLEPCFSCGRLISENLTGGGIHYEDGRAICNLCRESAVARLDEAEALLGGVRNTLRLLGMDLGTAATPLQLVGLSELKRGRARDLSGNTKTAVWTRDGEVIRREIEEISILHGLPLEHFCAVAAHEMVHAWLFLEKFPELPARVEEGVCELLSYLWLRQMGTLDAEHRMRVMEQNEDPVYGAGFRAALESHRQFPLPDLLRYVREHGRFPSD